LGITKGVSISSSIISIATNIEGFKGYAKKALNEEYRAGALRAEGRNLTEYDGIVYTFGKKLNIHIINPNMRIALNNMLATKCGSLKFITANYKITN
jgi:hypothetical protein